MKVLLGAMIILLALVSLGLVVYTYTEHREVAYLTLRADYLENRIIELEAGPSTVDSVGQEGTSTSTQVIALSEDVKDGEARGADLEARLDDLRWTEAEAIAVVQAKVRERLAVCDAQSHNDREGLLGTRTFGPGVGVCYFREDPVMWATPEGFLGRSLVKVMLEHQYQDRWSAKYEPDSYRWRVEASGQDVQPLVFHAYEKTGLVVGVPSTE
jgi:hypothetical protein